ncbi:MAG: NUDIX hydrolase [Magnetococcales bacterium]|nr:NUDIX hydrolase [Magnetococcales bacterium]
MRECPDHFYQQSAVIPVRYQGDQLQVMLISSRKGKRWVVPKGVIEPALTAEASAGKEALEEAGIRGVILPQLLGRFQYEKWGDTCTVQVFVMQVTEVMERWLEDFRSRIWLDVASAAKRMEEPALREMMTSRLPEMLAAQGVA